MRRLSEIITEAEIERHEDDSFIIFQYEHRKIIRTMYNDGNDLQPIFYIRLQGEKWLVDVKCTEKRGHYASK